MNPQIPVQGASPEPIVVPPTVPEKPKANNRIIALFSALVVLLLVSTGFLFYQNTNLQKKINTLSATPIASPEPTVQAGDPTADWKTYTNTQYGFSLKYPSQLTESADEGAPGVSGPIIGSSIFNGITSIFDPSILDNRNDAAFDGFTIYEIDTSLITNFTYASYLNNELAAIKNSPRGVQTATIQQISLGNQSYSYIDSETDIRRYFILSPDGKRLIIFSRIDKSPAFLSTFDQILSTFKFTSPSSDLNQKSVIDLIGNFYTALTKQDGKTLFDLMTKPATVAEETDFSWLTGVDLGTNAFYRAFLKTKITDPQISNIKIQSDGSYLVSITDKFSGYSNAGSEVGYTNPQARTGITMTIVNTNGQWLVDKFTDTNYQGGNATSSKYNGFDQ